jgi:hypothetical protein
MFAIEARRASTDHDRGALSNRRCAGHFAWETPSSALSFPFSESGNNSAASDLHFPAGLSISIDATTIYERCAE